MRIIQICGTSGVGKTTLARALIDTGLKRGEVLLDGAPKEVWYDGKTVLIGKYSGGGKCGGIDAGHYKVDALINALGVVLSEFSPDNVLFESLLLGKLYSSKKRVLSLSKATGYHYIQLVLTADFGTISERVIGRSGNDGCNFDRMIQEQRACIRSSIRLKKEGAEAIFIDTSKKSEEDVAQMLFKLLER